MIVGVLMVKKYRVVFNENAELFKVKPGELTRWYIINAGPRGHIAFNFASGMINSLSYENDNSATFWNNNNNYTAPIQL
jgi:nitrite reductase (NO-forming)